MRDVFDLAEEQHWTVRPKGDGWVFCPPKVVARPGHDSIYIKDPKSDSHSQQVLRTRLRNAGMRFDLELPTMPTTPKPTFPPNVDVRIAARELRNDTSTDPLVKLEQAVKFAREALGEVDTSLAAAKAFILNERASREQDREAFETFQKLQTLMKAR